MNIAEISHLSKVFKNGHKAVNDLSLNIKQGEIFGFLGPNGAGKSTTIRILTTLSKPTSGQAALVGYDLNSESAKIRKNIGYVAQDPGVDLNATGRENLILQGQMYHLPGKYIKERVSDLLQLVELADVADRLVRTYSGGMKKRLDIACGLIHQPRLLFLDEPTTGLDPHTRAHLWQYIRNLNRKEGISIFLTTHYLEEADALSNRIAIIDAGRIVAEGTPDQLKNDISGDLVTLDIVDISQNLINQAKDILKEQSFVKDLLFDENKFRIWVGSGSENLPDLFRLMERMGLKIKSMELSRPSLDDVFLKHTGRSLRDSGEES